MGSLSPGWGRKWAKWLVSEEMVRMQKCVGWWIVYIGWLK